MGYTPSSPYGVFIRKIFLLPMGSDRLTMVIYINENLFVSENAYVYPMARVKVVKDKVVSVRVPKPIYDMLKRIASEMAERGEMERATVSELIRHIVNMFLLYWRVYEEGELELLKALEEYRKRGRRLLL